jgi:hypothetical protein
MLELVATAAVAMRLDEVKERRTLIQAIEEYIEAVQVLMSRCLARVANRVSTWDRQETSSAPKIGITSRCDSDLRSQA